MTVSVRLALVAAVTIAGLGVVACSLDFDQFTIGDGGAENASMPPSMAKGGIDATSEKPDDAAATEASPVEETTALEASPLLETSAPEAAPAPEASIPEAATTPEASTPAAAPIPEASIPEAAALEAAVPPGGDAGCAALASCVTKAQTCGTKCSDDLTQCQKACGGAACQKRCTTTAQTCVTQCSNTCDVCAAIGGCAARSDCSAAAQGDL
jgi:hypothetical protein